jgi:hypothetical protein
MRLGAIVKKWPERMLVLNTQLRRSSIAHESNEMRINVIH